MQEAEIIPPTPPGTEASPRGKFDGVLLASDYDDTFYDRTFTISPENRAAVERFIAEGGRFAISTGRSLVNFAIQMEVEKPPVNAPVILSNGAEIYDFAAGRTLWKRTLPLTAADCLEEVCAALPALGFEAYHGEEVYTFRANSATQRHLKRCRLTGIPAEIRDMPAPWDKVILQHDDTALLQQAEDLIRARWTAFEVTFSNPTLLEMTARGANKGFCVRWLAEYLGIAPEHIYCVGNGINDIPMLAVSAIPFAPADSYQEVKDWGATLLPPCNESCVARLVEILEGRYGDSGSGTL